jgi:hypothetical protein
MNSSLRFFFSFDVPRCVGLACVLTLVAAASAVVAACDGQSTVVEDSSPGGTTLAAELCPASCAVVRTCSASLDVGACEAQCALELGGGGYLSAEIALKYFRILHDQAEDPDCHYTKMVMWEMDVLDQASYVPPVEDWSVLQACVTRASACSGVTSGPAEEACFFSFYRFNDGTRDAVRQCFLGSCSGYGDCVCAAQPSSGSPWVAIPAPPPDPVAPYRCPPAE